MRFQLSNRYCFRLFQQSGRVSQQAHGLIDWSFLSFQFKLFRVILTTNRMKRMSRSTTENTKQAKLPLFARSSAWVMLVKLSTCLNSIYLLDSRVVMDDFSHVPSFYLTKSTVEMLLTSYCVYCPKQREWEKRNNHPWRHDRPATANAIFPFL